MQSTCLSKGKILLAVGLMSGTSLDGIDAALLATDGETFVKAKDFISFPYSALFRRKLRSVLGGKGPIPEIERQITELHTKAVKLLLKKSGVSNKKVRVVGFHGHTISHQPQLKKTWQIGDGSLLARQTGIDVIFDFRSNDVARGGQGAPLVPLFHKELAKNLEHPVAILNIGGVANVTWIGAKPYNPIAFDTGPGCALLDDWIWEATRIESDLDGRFSKSGKINLRVVKNYMASKYFERTPPKTLDRDEFNLGPLYGIPTNDGAATLVEFTCDAIICSLKFMPKPPKKWLVSGGGRHNSFLMKRLAEKLDVPVAPVESVGWDGDALEAQAFAYLAIRSLKGLPLTLPSTTGVKLPTQGGRLCKCV